MLSVETPPPESPCACEISPLKSSCSEGDERAHDKIDLQEGVDLSKSLPKFSIRDYVFGTRSKDIKTNWPFSPKNLQLCLKHGVKELLPPFQSIDSVKNRSFNSCTAEISSIDKKNVSNSEGQHHGLSNCFASVHLDDAGCNRELTFDRVNIDLNGSEGDKEYPLTKNHQSNLSEVSGEKLEKSENASQPQVKKCRLILKVWGGVDPTSNEDNPPNCAIFPEPMASKVCPVCKTFSSSSNTTLNAHIDQCLTMESTVKWNNANSSVIKHRIKPRKTRLMVDIYATAKPCTLEELDRRNGTSWAITSSFPSQETPECDEVEKQRPSPGTLKDNGDEGAVYIDASGKKVRILSKFNDKAPMSEFEVDPKLSKPFRGRRSKMLPIRKKRHRSRKPHKYLKPASQSKKLCSSKTEHVSKVRSHLSRNLALRESDGKVKCLTMTSLKAEEQTTPNDSGTITKWASSKRSSLLKRCNRKESLLQVECNNSQELLVGSEQASLGDTFLERGCIQKTQDPSESPASSPASSKRLENSTSGAPISESHGHNSVRKKVEFSSFRSPVSGDRKKFSEPSKFNARQSRKYSTLDKSCEDLASYSENCVPSPGRRSVEINVSSVQSFDVSSSLLESHCTFSSKATKFSSLRKHVLGVNGSSMHESKNKVHRKCLTHKQPEVPLSAKVVSAELKEQKAENHSRAEEITCKSSIQRGSVFKIRKKRGAFSMRQKEQSAAMKSTPECHSYDMNNDLDSSGNLGHTYDGMEYEREGIEAHREETAFGLSSGVDVDGNALNSSKASDPQFQCSDDEQERFYEDTHMVAELDSRDGPGNYSNEVYPILIPELPGPFLPSPRDMGLENLQGNSSLTNIQVQSSEDNHDYVERDSSYSPISAISTLSNSTIARSDSKSSEKLSIGPHVAQDEMRSAESTTPVSEVSNRQAETINLDESKVIYEVGPSSFRNDQPCRCSWKDAASQSVSLNYQQSQLLRRRDMTLNDLDRRADGLNSLSEATSFGNFPSSRSDRIILPIPKSAAAPVPLDDSADCGLKVPIHGDCDSVSPSSSNPILRLMGKNLIVNKDDKASPSPQFQTLSAVSAHNVQSGDVNSLYHILHQNPLFGSRLPLNTSHMQSHTLEGMILSKNVGGGFTASLEPREYKVGYSWPTNDQSRMDNSLYTSSPFYMKNIVTTAVTQHQNANSSNNPMKEVIVIDDNAEGDAKSSASATVPYSEGMKRAQVSPAGISIPNTANYKLRHVNPFHSYQPQAPSLYCGSPLVQTTGFPLPSHSRVNTIPLNWNYASESPTVLPASSLMASSSSAGHLRPPYYSQNFS
ncbi:hypothetical protein NMG60_11018977 [Bertholletia excelsa]